MIDSSHRTLLLASALVLSASSSACSDTGSSSDTQAPEQVTGPEDVNLEGGQGAVVVEITGGSASGWLFGMIYSDNLDEGCREADDTCFSLDGDGGTVEWCDDEQSTDCSDLSAAAYVVGYFSFVLKPTVGLGCWSWGGDADYYDDLGCTQMDWHDYP